MKTNPWKAFGFSRTALLALILCGVMTTPAWATSDPAESEEPPPVPPQPVLSASWTDEGKLRLELESDGQRYTLDIAGQRGRTLTVEAAGTNGEIAAAADIQNRYYIPPGAAALTPEGNGTVMDDVVQDDGKEIFTFTTPEGNEYFLIIDRSRDTENVYLLNAVRDGDLAPLSNYPISSPSYSPYATAPPSAQTATPVEEPLPAPSGSGESNQYFFIIGVIVVVGGLAYYFKIHRNKGKKKRRAVPEDEPEEVYDDEDDLPDDQIAFPQQGDDSDGERWG